MGQIINVQVDTGSSALAVPLEECVNCRGKGRRFNAALAQGGARFISCDSVECGKDTCYSIKQCTTCSTGGAYCSRVAPSKCGFFLGFPDGSGADGGLANAVVGIADMEMPLTFRSILRVSDGFENFPVDGILGMRYASQSCNPTCVTPLFDTLVREGKVAWDVFAMCTGKHGGQLLLGGSGKMLYDGALQYVPIRSKPGGEFCDVDIRGAPVGAFPVKLPHFSVGIVESGTALLVVTPATYIALRDHFQTHYCQVPGLCPSLAASRMWAPGGGGIVRVVEAHGFGRDADMGMERGANVSYGMGMGPGYSFPHPMCTADDNETNSSWFNPAYCAALSNSEVRFLPDISIELEGRVSLTVGPDDYMLKRVKTSVQSRRRVEFRCLGIASMQELEKMEINVVIGDSWLQKFYVEYDREMHRVGFAVSKNCILPGQELTPWLNEDYEDGPHAHGLSVGLLEMILFLCGFFCISGLALEKQYAEIM